MNLNDLYQQYASGKLSKPEYIERMHEKHLALFDYQDYLLGTDVESIEIGNKEIVLTVKKSGIKLLLNMEDSRFIPIEMINFHSIDNKERALLDRLMPKQATVFDVGANIGWYSLNFAKSPKVKAVYAFEPIPYTFGYLGRHLEMNKAAKVKAVNVGLSNVEGKRSFFWTRGETGSSSLANLRQRSRISKVNCQLTTMDKFVSRKRLKVDLIKCDVEGAELFVFQGGLKTIARDKPIIYTELLRKWSKVFGYHPNDVIDMLARLGYKCYGFVGDKLERIERVSDELETTNFFFLQAARGLQS